VMGYHAFALIDALWPGLAKQAQMDKLAESVSVAGEAMTAFLGSAIADLMDVEGALDDMELTKIDMSGAPNLHSTDLPFLVQMDGKTE
jgi:hypothetical protein